MLYIRLFASVLFANFLIKGFCNEKLVDLSSLEAKVGYFFFADSKMRKIYNQGGLDIQISSSYPMWNWKEKVALDFYGSIEYLQRSGYSLGYHQKTSIWQIPVNVGVKPIFEISSKVQCYVALGPRYFYIHQYNRSSYVRRDKARNGIGMFANTGFNFILQRHLLLDVFGEYSYEKIRFHSPRYNTYTRNVQVGGFTFGGGLGYVF